MSGLVKLKLPAGGSKTLSAPDSASDEVITLPAGTKTLATVENFTSTGIDDNATSTAITIDASENVGIGTTAPAGKLDVLTSTTGGLKVEDGIASAGGIAGANITTYQGSTNSNVRSLTVEAQNFIVRTGVPQGTTTTERMRIDSSGNMLWKQSGSQIVPPVNQTVMCGDSGVGQTLRFNGSHGYRQNIGFFYNSSQVGSIITTTSSTSYNTSSDYRLKENVVPMTGSIDRLKQLKPSRFNFIADADTTVDGFLAHEAGEVVPECATGEKDAMTTEEYEVTPAVKDEEGNVVTEAVMGTREVPDYQGIDQSKLVPLLVASLQEAVDKIEALETRVTQLENNV